MSGERFLRRPAVEEMTGLSRSRIYALMSDGAFPKPLHISVGCVAWRESEIRAWQRARIAAHDQSAA